MTGRTDLEDKGWRTVTAFTSELRQAPIAHTQMLAALDFAIGPTSEVVIAGTVGSKAVADFKRELRSRFEPNMVVLMRDTERAGEIIEIAPFTRDLTPLDGQAAVYVCRGHACLQPTTDPHKLGSLLSGPSTGKPG